MCFSFYTGSLLYTDGPTPPKTNEVLGAVQSDCSAGGDSFLGFCDSLGYDSDSRKAHSIWKACRRIRKDCARVFREEFESFMSEDFDV
jgi:hypothetical protein